MKEIISKLTKSLDQVEQWAEQRDYKGYEPSDGQSSFLRPLTFGNEMAERILQQFVWKIPFNVRPLFGVRPLESTKARGYFVWGYVRRFQTTGDEHYRKKAELCLDWLMNNPSPGQDEFCWGNHFHFTSRGGRMAKYEPTIVWTSLIGLAFLEAHHILGGEKYLEVADSICRWILTLPRLETDHGSCLAYTGVGTCTIHNSNMLGAGMLAKTAALTGNEEYVQVARKAIEYSCSRQLSDGAWYYGDESKYHWIDNFHTGYNLDSLRRFMDATGDRSYDELLKKGLEYMKKTFIEDSGRPRYYHNSTYPIDIQCCSQAIDTLVYFSDLDPACLDLAIKTAEWTIDNMQDSTGFFYYRRLPGIVVKTPMMHWGQGTMHRALAELIHCCTDKMDTDMDNSV